MARRKKDDTSNGDGLHWITIDQPGAENGDAPRLCIEEIIDALADTITATAQLIEENDIVRTHEPVKTRFTEDEQRENAQALARIFPEITRIEDEKKSIVSQYKSQVEALQAQANQLSSYVRDGFRMLPTPIIIRRDYRTGRFVKIRTDTGEVILERALTADERQRAMF